MNFRDPNWSITQLLIKAGAAIEVAGWVTLSDDLIQVTPMELVESWTSKFGIESGLPLLKSIIRERLYARVNVKGQFFKNVTYSFKAVDQSQWLHLSRKNEYIEFIMAWKSKCCL